MEARRGVISSMSAKSVRPFRDGCRRSNASCSRRSSRRNPLLTEAEQRDIHRAAAFFAEVEFRAWTADTKLRHSSFKGVIERDDMSIQGEEVIFDRRPCANHHVLGERRNHGRIDHDGYSQSRRGLTAFVRAVGVSDRGGKSRHSPARSDAAVTAQVGEPGGELIQHRGTEERTSGAADCLRRAERAHRFRDAMGVA